MITDEHFNQLDKLLAKCAEHPEVFTDWENNFCSEWCDKLSVYQQNVRVSDKQDAIFARLEEKLKKAYT